MNKNREGSYSLIYLSSLIILLIVWGGLLIHYVGPSIISQFTTAQAASSPISSTSFTLSYCIEGSISGQCGSNPQITQTSVLENPATPVKITSGTSPTPSRPKAILVGFYIFIVLIIIIGGFFLFKYLQKKNIFPLKKRRALLSLIVLITLSFIISKSSQPQRVEASNYPLTALESITSASTSTFSLNYKNSSSERVLNLIVTTTIASNMNYVPNSSANGQLSNNIITWHIGSLSAGQGGTLSYQATTVGSTSTTTNTGPANNSTTTNSPTTSKSSSSNSSSPSQKSNTQSNSSSSSSSSNSGSSGSSSSQSSDTSSKPAANTPVNWSQPLSRDLVSLVALNEGSSTSFYDAAKNQSYQATTLSGTPSGAPAPSWFTPAVTSDYPWKGSAINNQGGTVQSIETNLPPDDFITTTTTGYSYAMLIDPLDTTTRGRFLDATGAAVVTIYVNFTGADQISTTWRDSSDRPINPVYDFTPNKWILVLFTVQQGLGVMYVNGTEVASSTSVNLANSVLNQTGDLSLNTTGNGSMSPNTDISSWWIWNNRVLTAQEATEMYSDPWAMLR